MSLVAELERVERGSGRRISEMKGFQRRSLGARGAGVFAKTSLPHAARSRIIIFCMKTPLAHAPEAQRNYI